MYMIHEEIYIIKQIFIYQKDYKNHNIIKKFRIGRVKTGHVHLFYCINYLSFNNASTCHIRMKKAERDLLVLTTEFLITVEKSSNYFYKMNKGIIISSRVNRFNGSPNVEARETLNTICIMRGRFIGFHDIFPPVDHINSAIESRQMKLQGGPPLGHATECNSQQYHRTSSR